MDLLKTIFKTVAGCCTIIIVTMVIAIVAIICALL